MPDAPPSRDDLCSRYLDQLPYPPYPVQEEALLAWFTAPQGVLVCAPTGTGKTLIAEAALFEALHTGRTAYYTTPLIALTEQKFREMQAAAVRWGFHPDDVGLVTGNRCVNPDAHVLVVVAEILLNRLLHPAAFDFANVASVVMDEFHSFNDPERGVVWELSLGLLPPHVRLLLLSATVGNTAEFLIWLRQSHDRAVQLVQSTDRRVPLEHLWVPDQLLSDQLEIMADGTEETRRTPALVFCFNRDECWDVAEQLKGKALVDADRQKQLLAELDQHPWNTGVGPKLRPILLRGVGVHHAGLLPKYRRIVEDLFQRKLLSVCVCTETLAAGINLPARSVVLTTLLKGPPGQKKLIEPSAAHQMFGRAGRPQFDSRGFVYALAHEDDVKILRWKEKHDTIPEDTKDPHLIAARKRILKKMPTRRATEQYWNDQQFERLRTAPPGKLASRGHLPWRLLAYLLQLSPEVARVRNFVSKRLLDDKQTVGALKQLRSMLLTLWAGGYVTLDPEPPADLAPVKRAGEAPSSDAAPSAEPDPSSSPTGSFGTLGQLLTAARSVVRDEKKGSDGKKPGARGAAGSDEEPERTGPPPYEPVLARATPLLDRLLVFRSVNPLYGDFLVKHLGKADPAERIQALESVLDMPGSVARSVRVPPPDRMPPGTLAREFLDQEIVQRGLIAAQDLYPPREQNVPPEERKYAPPFADKLRMLFDAEFPGVHDLRTRAVWAAGDLLDFLGDFDKYVAGRSIARQEGILFRHFLRLILVCGEFSQIVPPDIPPDEWTAPLREMADRLTEACRAVDPTSTDHAIAAAQAVPDVVQGEAAVESPSPVPFDAEDAAEAFGAGL